MLTALKLFLESKGHTNIYCDYMPDIKNTKPQAINVTMWDYTVGNISDGTGVKYVQVQCRDSSYAAAKDTCTAIFKLLDSGVNEVLINLTDTVFCIARPRRGPIIYERGSSYTTFYCEIALWGIN